MEPAINKSISSSARDASLAYATPQGREYRGNIVIVVVVFISSLVRAEYEGQDIYIIELSTWIARKEVFCWVPKISHECRPWVDWTLPADIGEERNNG